MKRLSMLCVAVLAAGWAEVQAASIGLAWEPTTTYTDGTPATDIAGYKVYYGTTSRTYTACLDVGNVTTGRVTGLRELTTYYFAVTAYNTVSNESAFSDELVWTNGPAPRPGMPLLIIASITTTPTRISFWWLPPATNSDGSADQIGDVTNYRAFFGKTSGVYTGWVDRGTSTWVAEDCRTNQGWRYYTVRAQGPAATNLGAAMVEVQFHPVTTLLAPMGTKKVSSDWRP